MKKDLSLYLAFGVPLLMVIIVALVIIIPRFTHKPAYDFVYSTSDTYYYGGTAYTVVQGEVTKKVINPLPKDTLPVQTDPKLYYYDVAKNESREISFAEAQKLQLNPNSLSPDGYEVVQNNRDDVLDFFFSRDDYGARYLRGNGVSTKLNLVKTNSDYYSPYFSFLGWVISNK